MNIDPSNFKYYKRFIDNNGSVKIPGYNPITGRKFTKINDDEILLQN
jgi:hypothetical protein